MSIVWEVLDQFVKNPYAYTDRERFQDEQYDTESDHCPECGKEITYEQFEDGFCYNCDTDYDADRCEVCGDLLGTCECGEGE